MEKTSTELLIIGGGPGGYVAAIYAAKQGRKVTLVDQKKIGGTCLNEGCIPTKALVRSAEIYQDILNADHHGIQIKEATFDLAKIIENKNAVKDKLVQGVEFLLKKYGVDVLNGHARFVDNQTVDIEGEFNYRIQATDIIIATGSKTKHLPIEGINNPLVVDSEVLLDNTKLPKTLNVIGGGIIGMEFAFIYAALGVKVNVIEFLPRILPGVDKELGQRLLRFAKQLGIQILVGAAVKKIEAADGQAIVHFERKEKMESLAADLVLEAVGRAPNIDGLGLENTDVTFDERKGIPVDSHLRTNLEHVYAIGDVTNLWQLAHVASHQGLVAVDNILGHAKEIDYSAVPAVIFTMPQIATVGKTEDMCKEENIDYEVVKVPYSANGKALILEGEAGFIKLIRDPASKILIGGMVFGKEAENLIAPITIAIRNRLKAEDLQETIFAHPTVMELIHEGAMGLDHLAIHFVD